MTTTIRLLDLPPHFRLLAWPALHGSGRVPGVSVDVPPALTGQPPSLLCGSDEVFVSLPRDPGEQETVGLLLEASCTDLLSTPVKLLCALVLWDEVVREHGIFQGNIYFASESSVSNLLAVAGEPVPGDLAAVLHDLHSLELLYRFPVAWKFRGAHGLERQCRANGWGRLFGRLVRSAAAGRAMTDPWRELLSAHALEHREAYRQGVELASRADDNVETAIWERIIATQPIPLLV